MIEVQKLRKSFKATARRAGEDTVTGYDPRQQGKLFHAVQDVSFRCDKGHILGIVGPNGAGKTTTLRMLSTALKPSSGRIFIDGEDYSGFPNEIRSRIGFLSGNTGLYPRLTAREMVHYFGKLHGVPNKELNTRIDQLFERFNMHSFSGERTDKLSTGMKQKVNIVRTLIHGPSILILDEPTTGLDIMTSRTILEFIRECRNDNRTIVFSTHNMHEVEALCDSLVVIHQGHSCFHGTTGQLRGQFNKPDLAEAFLSCIGETV